jgi:hypothetical protein
VRAVLILGDRGPRHGDAAGAHGLDDRVRRQQFLERRKAIRMLHALQQERVGAGIDDAGVEDLGHAHDLQPMGGVGLHLDQQELPLDRHVRMHLENVDHIDQLVELLDNLLHRVAGAVDADGDHGAVGALRRPHREAIDVEAAPREQARNARQHARLVLDQHAQCVMSRHGHQTPSSTHSFSQTSSIISCEAAPAGTIG